MGKMEDDKQKKSHAMRELYSCKGRKNTWDEGIGVK
jgi:hypothetical protein